MKVYIKKEINDYKKPLFFLYFPFDVYDVFN